MRWNKKQQDEVIAEYQEKVEKHPSNVVYRSILGTLYDSPEKIKETVEIVIEINSNFYPGYELLASAFQRDEDYTSAIESLRKIFSRES
jgi:hypothetical protein